MMVEADNIFKVPVVYGYEGGVPRFDIGLYGDCSMETVWEEENSQIPCGLEIDNKFIPIECNVFSLDADVWKMETQNELGAILRNTLNEVFSVNAYQFSLEASRIDAVLAGRGEIRKTESVPESEQYSLSGSFFAFLAQNGEGKCLSFYEQVVEEKGKEVKADDHQHEVVYMKKLWRAAKELGEEDSNRYLQSLIDSGVKSVVYQVIVPELEIEINVVKVGNLIEDPDQIWPMMVEAAKSWIQIGNEMGEEISGERLIFYEMYNLADVPGKMYLSDNLSDLTESGGFSADECVVVIPNCTSLSDENGQRHVMIDGNELIGVMRHEMTHMLDFFGESGSSVLSEGMAVAMQHGGDFDLIAEELRGGWGYTRVVTEPQMENLYGLAPGGLRRVVSRVFQCDEEAAGKIIQNYIEGINLM